VPTPDPEQERERLAQFYRAMSDGELLKLESNCDSLTETAFEALQDEIERRGLEDPEEAPPAKPPQGLEFRNLVTVRKFRDLPEALLAKGALESVGIECSMADDNLVRLDWFISNFVGGIKLRVRPEDAERATQLLDEPMLEGMYVEGVGFYEQPRCPKCDSLDVSFQGLNKPVAYGSAYFGLPIPLQRDSWKCAACNEEWEETEENL
jgi:hypothetical protein